MMKSVTALIMALAVGWIVAGSATEANANHLRPGCQACGGPLPPKTYYKTVHPTSYRTRYHDVSVFKRVPRIQQIVTVTRVQPIVRIHEVTRVHHRNIFYTQNAYANVTQNLPPLTYFSHSTQNIYHCGCGY